MTKSSNTRDEEIEECPECGHCHSDEDECFEENLVPIGKKVEKLTRQRVVEQLKAERDCYREALTDLFKMMDENILVRNTDKDHLPEWAELALGTVYRLKRAYEALAKYVRENEGDGK